MTVEQSVEIIATAGATEVDGLIARMTLEEKIAQLYGVWVGADDAGGDVAPHQHDMDQHLDFDLDLAKSQSQDNPVYYVQYAHARVCSVHEQWGGKAEELSGVELTLLTSEQELSLLQKLIEYPDTVEDAARELAPHLIAFYLRDLASTFHSYYNATRVLVDDPALKLARLALATAVRQVLRNGLQLLGVGAPERM